MAKAKKKTITNKQTVLICFIALLVSACLILILMLMNRNQLIAEYSKPTVSTGSMTYQFKNGKFVKRDAKELNKLQNFLENEAAESGCTDKSPDHEFVVAHSKDISQVLIKHGCGNAMSSMFLVKNPQGEWKSISPTNHFDNFGIPECNYVGKNDISVEIAPVCINGDLEAGSPLGYQVR